MPKPRILGADGAGLVDGERVVINPGIEHGDRITVIGEHMDGTHAELIAVPRGNVYPIPDGMSFEEAAAFPLVFETAYRMLVTRAGVREGEWVLLWGIGSGIATAANVIARALGARTIVTSSSDEKLARVEADAKVESRVRGRGRGRQGGDRRGAAPTSSSSTSGEATWQRSLQAVRQGGRIDRLRRDDRTEPAGRAPPRLVEAAHDLRLDDGDEGGLRGRLRAREERPGEAGRRRGLPALGGASGARAHGGRRAARQDRPPNSALNAAGAVTNCRRSRALPGGRPSSGEGNV